jgi:hypothetical protein
LLPTPPHGCAVTGHSPLNDVIGGDVFSYVGGGFQERDQNRSILVRERSSLMPSSSNVHTHRCANFGALGSELNGLVDAEGVHRCRAKQAF